MALLTSRLFRPSARPAVWLRGLALGAVLAAAAAWAAPNVPKLPEYTVKAAFLYNFGHFVTWPAYAFASSDAPLELWILGEAPFEDALEALRGRTVQGRKLSVRHATRVEDVRGAHILFVSRAFADPNQVLSDLGARPILTVGDAPGFSDRGGVIAFHVVDKQVRFDVNLPAARRAGLVVNARLLKLADAVRTEDER